MSLVYLINRPINRRSSYQPRATSARLANRQPCLATLSRTSWRNELYRAAPGAEEKRRRSWRVGVSCDPSLFGHRQAPTTSNHNNNNSVEDSGCWRRWHPALQLLHSGNYSGNSPDDRALLFLPSVLIPWDLPGFCLHSVLWICLGSL